MYNENQSIRSVLPGSSPCVGRQGLVTSITQLVSGRDPVVVNLVGPRWIGKTKVLKCLDQQQPQPEGMDSDPAAGVLLYVYVDLLEKEEDAAASPFAAIANALRRALEERPALKPFIAGLRADRSVERSLADLAKLVKDHGLRPVILIDHLDKVYSPSEPLDLRPLALLKDDVSLVLATRQTLSDISPELAGSPLVHSSYVLSLGLLDKAAAVDLLLDSNIGRATYLSAPDIEKLITFVGRHPYLLIRAAPQAHDLLQESVERREHGITINDIRSRIEPALRPFFEGLWQEYKNALLKYQDFQNQHANDARGDREKQNREYEVRAERAVRQELQRAALIYEDPTAKEKEKFNYFSPLFESFVFQKTEAAASAMDNQRANPTAPLNLLETLDVRAGTKEYELLNLLLNDAGAVVADARLEAEVWGDEATERAIVTTISRLRGKLHEHRINGRIVRVRKEGYSFQLQA